MPDEEILNAYEKLWPDGGRIREIARRCGGPYPPRRAGDYLGLDLLNDGLRGVWSLAEFLGLDETSDVLELGSGIGGPSRFIAERYRCHVTGIDITPHQVEVARALSEGLDINSKIKFIVGDARKLPFPSASFTHVYSTEALVHVSQKQKALQEAFRVLQSSGTICIRDPVGSDVQIALLEKTLHPMSLGEYESALLDVGFCNIVSVDCTRHSEKAYEYLSEFVAEDPISPFRLLRIFKYLHPNIRPFWEFFNPWRIRKTFQYILNPYSAAIALFGDPNHVRRVHQMCKDIVFAYRSGALKMYQIRATKLAY